MTPFEHTIVTCLMLHRRLGEKDGSFMPTAALNALPRRTYINGRLQEPKLVPRGEFYQALFYGDADYELN